MGGFVDVKKLATIIGSRSHRARKTLRCVSGSRAALCERQSNANERANRNGVASSALLYNRGSFFKFVAIARPPSMAATVNQCSERYEKAQQRYSRYGCSRKPRIEMWKMAG
ncbi:hypothetical protein ZHAS_00019578 [Anopheles sinensis]|uniref:Uncharacterized protein n=1 Tax=Anopheles sinensis TaxID=74873 RepID=A0A084WMS3_ANOSI|nr:hypothetical protein ZHAS_00019578 [Anopheles sinensis]